MPAAIEKQIGNARRSVAWGVVLLCVCPGPLLHTQAGAAVLSSKRGFADVSASYSNLQATGAGWYYTWGLGQGYPGGFDAQHAPMFWGGWAVNQTNITNVKNNPDVEWVLGFNEPERSDQANMTVAQAISAWTTLSNGFAGSGKKLVSPAVSDTSSGQSWITDFKNQATAAGLQVDAVAFHWYGVSNPNDPAGAASSFISRINWYHNLWNKPVFITEFAIHDWGGNYSDEEISEANRQFLDIVVPWMESSSYVAGYAVYPWFSDARLYEGSPPTPTRMGYEYIGVVESGESQDIGGLDLGEHVAYLAGGELTMTGSPGTVRYLNALEGANSITGTTDWTIGVSGDGWVRVRPDTTLKKTGANLVLWDGIDVTNEGAVEVNGGTLSVSRDTTFSGSGGLRVNVGGTLNYVGTPREDTINVYNSIELRGGLVTLASATDVLLQSGAVLAGNGTVGGNLNAKSGAFIRVGGDGLLVPSRYRVDDFESYALGNVRDTASPPWTAHQDTGFADIEDYSGNNVLTCGWTDNYRGASRDMPDDALLAAGDVTTLFFRFNSKTDDPDHSFGLGDRADTGVSSLATSRPRSALLTTPRSQAPIDSTPGTAPGSPPRSYPASCPAPGTTCGWLLIKQPIPTTCTSIRGRRARRQGIWLLPDSTSATALTMHWRNCSCSPGRRRSTTGCDLTTSTSSPARTCRTRSLVLTQG